MVLIVSGWGLVVVVVTAWVIVSVVLGLLLGPFLGAGRRRRNG